MEPQKLTEEPYHVFLNHRGEDVKESIVSLIYNFLKLKNLRVFLDQKEISYGDEFDESIKKALESASVHLAFFSSGYAGSKWCLDELVLMLKSKGRVIPVFCDIEPWNLRYIEKGCYKDAFIKHEHGGRYEPKEITEWKEALFKAAGLQGVKFEAKKSNHWNFVENIAAIVLKALGGQTPYGLARPTEDFPVGGSSWEGVRQEGGQLPRFILTDYALPHAQDLSELSEPDEPEEDGSAVSELFEAEGNGPSISELFGTDGLALSALYMADEDGPAIAELYAT